MQTITYVCKECAGVLKVTEDVTHTDTFLVPQCMVCLQKQREKGYDIGYTEGFNMGFDSSGGDD